jgi:chitinase
MSTTHTVTVRTSTQSPSNQPPSVSLTDPLQGASFTAPASITLNATATDSDGSIARVEFYRGSTLIGIDTSRPYSAVWSNVGAGSYSLTAVARDNAGATTVSSTRDITVGLPGLPTTAVFNPSSNHSTAVDHYVLEVFPAGADTRVANPVATRDLGKPPVASGQITVDVASTIRALTPGSYVATVTAYGDGGATQSVASPPFIR